MVSAFLASLPSEGIGPSSSLARLTPFEAGKSGMVLSPLPFDAHPSHDMRSECICTTNVVLPIVNASLCFSARGKLATRGGESLTLKSSPTFTDGPEYPPGRKNDPCLEPMSTTAHSRLPASQNIVACSLETAISFNLTRGVPLPAGATSLPNCTSLCSSSTARRWTLGRTELVCTSKRSRDHDLKVDERDSFRTVVCCGTSLHPPSPRVLGV